MEPPTEPPGFRSTDWLLPPACSSICLLVPWALTPVMPATRIAAVNIVNIFIRSSFPRKLNHTSLPRAFCSCAELGQRLSIFPYQLGREIARPGGLVAVILDAPHVERQEMLLQERCEGASELAHARSFQSWRQLFENASSAASRVAS